MKKSSKLITFLLLFISLLSPFPIFAQDSFSGLGFHIDPSITELNLDPGDSAAVRINISKDHKDPIPMTIYTSEYLPEEDPTRDYSGLPDCLDWLTLKENAIILDSATRRNLLIEVQVPKDAVPGTYFSTVVFSPILPESYFLDQSAHIYPHIGALVVINVNGERFSEKVKIEAFDYTAETEEPSYFTSSLVNDDRYYSTVKGEIIVQDLFGNIKDSLKVEETKVLPGEKRQLINELSNELPFGLYKAKFHLVKRNELVTESVSFISLNTPTATLIVVLIILIIFAYTLTKYILDILKKSKYPKVFA